MSLCGGDLWLLGEVDGRSEVVCIDLRSMKPEHTPLWAADRMAAVAVPSGTTVQASHVTDM